MICIASASGKGRTPARILSRPKNGPRLISIKQTTKRRVADKTKSPTKSKSKSKEKGKDKKSSKKKNPSQESPDNVSLDEADDSLITLTNCTSDDECALDYYCAGATICCEVNTTCIAGSPKSEGSSIPFYMSTYAAVLYGFIAVVFIGI